MKITKLAFLGQNRGGAWEGGQAKTSQDPQPPSTPTRGNPGQ